MAKKRIYLAGNISSDPATYKWRDKATKLLEEEYTVLNPANNKFNRGLLKAYKENPEEFKKGAIDKRILVVKDYQLVAGSDIILVNMQIITPEKPVIGTLFELAWAWYLKIPVIAIIADNWFCQHPFTVASFSATADSLEEAVHLIKYFFNE